MILAVIRQRRFSIIDAVTTKQGRRTMPAFSKGDYTAMDRPEVLSVLFHPRKEYEGRIPNETAMDVFIPVEDNVGIGGCFHMARSDGPNILFFHGNGEIVSDYDDLGPMYNQMGINFFAVDYRGYGRSSGTPTIAAMMSDCHNIFDFARNWLIDSGYSGPMMVMGRSLGSASALELAFRHPEKIDALIVESGFAHTAPLLRLLGVRTSGHWVQRRKRIRKSGKDKNSRQNQPFSFMPNTITLSRLRTVRRFSKRVLSRKKAC